MILTKNAFKNSQEREGLPFSDLAGRDFKHYSVWYWN